MRTKVQRGTEVKLNINVKPMEGKTLKDYDFTVEVYCFGAGRLKFTKSDVKITDNENLIVCADTTKLGVGVIRVRMVAEIPDLDFADGKRTEIAEIDSGVQIV